MENPSIYDLLFAAIMLVAITLATLFSMKQKKSWWMEMLSDKPELTKTDLEQMYFASIERGRSPVAELLGDLNALRAELSLEEYEKILGHYNRFTKAIGDMEMYFGMTPNLFESSRTQAIDEYKALEVIAEARKLRNIQYVPPWIA